MLIAYEKLLNRSGACLELCQQYDNVCGALHVQDKSTTGKQGLGIKDRKKKVAGCYFEGKKTSFDDSDDEGSADPGSPIEDKQDGSLEMGSSNEPKVKLKKLCKQLICQVSPLRLFI